MKPKKTLWKKIEHWIVLIIFFGSIAFNIVILIWGSELGLVKERLGDDDNKPMACDIDPRYPCI